ncbi:hypothetical protein IWW50_005315 [Coemansia erecta]|nr:hypothetical protein IWW50_005315 [Coemansia erecta]
MAGCAIASPVFFGGGFFDPLTGSGTGIAGAASVDGGGNSFVRVDQDTRIQGQNIANLNQDSVTGQQSGPAIEANGAVVVTT